MQGETLSLPFLLPLFWEESEGECLVLNGINRFWRLGRHLPFGSGNSSRRWNENRIALVKMPAVILPVTIIANCVVLAVETPLPNGDKTQLARDLVRHISSTCTCLEKFVASGLCSSMSDVSWRDMLCLRVKRGNKFAWETFFYPRHCVPTCVWLWSKVTLDFRHYYSP